MFPPPLLVAFNAGPPKLLLPNVPIYKIKEVSHAYSKSNYTAVGQDKQAISEFNSYLPTEPAAPTVELIT